MTINFPLVIEGETSDLQVHAPGFLTEVKRGLGGVEPLTHHGRRSAICIADLVLQTQDDRLRLSDALQALPDEWAMAFHGVEAPVKTAASQVAATMSRLESGIALAFSPYEPTIEAAITDAKGEILVLLQQSCQTGSPSAARNSKYLSAHVTRRAHSGAVFGAIHEFCSSNEITVHCCDPDQGYQVTRWDFSRTEQARAFLEEFDTHLDDLEYCRKSGLLQFCRLDLAQIIKATNILDF
ncbi:hypothetical protein Rfer_4277 (plasmid) [Rhodoferax ferrireducens T118]|uniref:Uncharacterized protein n=1 Tax=Albidiferax ferrireducens (strain ATCC BAA-621 / DSM 15236 / T118) TaxID=338969 RepID=Q21QI1_ALBFT|nr:hypothetical protein [Rhodoferax ferrireducens]ABD71964.1 hypothetical protein Rfer_4277 [Rhodoferax ferrireducens T118]